MKITNKKLTVPYEEIHVGECFKYDSRIYIKSKNGGVTEDVNLENGNVTISLKPNTKVTYLPNATVNIFEDE